MERSAEEICSKQSNGRVGIGMRSVLIGEKWVKKYLLMDDDDS
jgi:hypothetical protein